MGVTKLLKKKGDGKTFPKPGQKVAVHYTGYLGVVRGAKFDSSRDRKEPFEFNIGQGQVIRGWDEGVAQMSLGERSYLICTHDVAYGAEGSPGGIPPYSTLIFDVELLKVN